MRKRSTAALFTTLALVACHSGFSINPPPQSSDNIALINGISDSGGLKAQVSSTLTLGPVTFGGSDTNLIAPGSYNVQFTAGAAGASPFTVNNVSVANNQLTTLVGYGTVAANTQNALSAGISLSAPASGQIVVQPVNAAYTFSQHAGSATLDFYFVTPGTTIDPTTKGGISAAFGPVTPSNVATIAGAKYEIIVGYDPCLPPSNCMGLAKAFDSGPNGITLPTAAGSSIFQFAAIDASSAQNTQYGSQISLVLLGNNGDTMQLFNGQN